MIAASLVLALLLQDAVEPPPPRRTRSVQSSVRIVIEENPKGDYDHDYYEQDWPVRHKTGTPALGSEIWYRTVCRPQEDDREPLVFTVPDQPPRVTLSGVLSSPQFNVSVPKGTIVPGRQRSDPIITKAGLFSGGSSDSTTTTESDSPFLYGTDLDYVLAPDVTGWSPTSWLPGETSFHLYGRALFGTLEVFDTKAALQLYSIGPRLGIPVARWGVVELDCTISAGPAFLHTDIGDAVGFDGGIGLRVSTFFTRSFSLIAEIEANLYASENVTAFGPVLNLGFNLSW
ncbi:MAG TPA: hypothetical protein VE981_21890 [Planctomycetota bacterium]|nr:hypothetical protein [Planctomycetota bacterium]